MKEKYEILLVGDVYDNHLKRLIRNLKEYNPNAVIDVLSFKRDFDNYIGDIEGIVRDIFYIKPLPSRLIGVPILSTIVLLYNIKSRVRKINNKRYNCINIHFPYWLWNICIHDFKKMTPTLLLSPWGSDVYRIGEKDIIKLTKLYKAANYVGCSSDRFVHDVKEKFNVADDKIINLKIGSETIDYIYEYSSKISPEHAKQRLNIEGKYAITCGYNGSPAQNHISMIEAIATHKESLPKNLILLFPVTYLHDDAYIDKLKESLKTHHLEGLFFEKYLSVEDLFLLRQATDMFIHVQNTDAANSTLKEYILCGKVCLNGSWLEYHDLKKMSPVPYHQVKSMATLGNDIVDAYNAKKTLVSEESRKYIASLGWKECIKDWDEFYTSMHNKL